MANLGRMTQLWFAKAEEDLRVAQSLLSLKSEHFESIVFHCQQSVEKAIKGYLTHHKVRFPKTHDIEKLLNLVTTVDSALVLSLDKTKVLTKYAVAYRYPEEIEELEPLDRDSVDDLCKVSKNAFEALKNAQSK